MVASSSTAYIYTLYLWVPSARTYLREHVPRTYEHPCGLSREVAGRDTAAPVPSCPALRPRVGERLAANDQNPASQNFARSIPALFPIFNFCWLAAALADEKAHEINQLTRRIAIHQHLNNRHNALGWNNRLDDRVLWRRLALRC